MTYCIPACAVETVYEIKKSRFIARAEHARTREEALQHLARARQDYPDARHHCWAYQLGSPSSPLSAAMSDDGEPGGTAGKPILNVIQHKDVGDIMIIVIRYFGGIKLGAGGLVRAYSTSAQQAMDELRTTVHVDYIAVRASVDFRHEQRVRHWAADAGCEVNEAEYSDRVILPMQIPAPAREGLLELLAELKGTLSE